MKRTDRPFETEEQENKLVNFIHYFQQHHAIDQTLKDKNGNTTLHYALFVSAR